MEIDPTRMCELLVGLPGVDVIGVAAPAPGWLIVQRGGPGAAPVLWPVRDASVGEGLPGGGPGRSPSVRPAGGAAGDPDPVVLPGGPLRGRVLDDRAPRDRPRRSEADHPGWAVGDRAGRPLRPLGQPRWPTRWAPTGTPSTTPSSPTAKRSSTPTSTGSAPCGRCQLG